MTLEKEGQVLLRFAMAYGFRNIQNLVQKLKRGRCPYHYVEVMACPSGRSSQVLGPSGQLSARGILGYCSGKRVCAGTPTSYSSDTMPTHLLCSGCLNGGGQLKATDVPGKELLQQVERLYSMIRVEAPEDAPGVRELYQHWLQGEGSEQASHLLHTQYHAVEKASSGLNIRW